MILHIFIDRIRIGKGPDDFYYMLEPFGIDAGVFFVMYFNNMIRSIALWVLHNFTEEKCISFIFGEIDMTIL